MRSCLYPPLYRLLEAARRRRLSPEQEIAAWIADGKPFPPPHIVKQRLLAGYARRFSLAIFVESGTYLGDMVAALAGEFTRLYSVELSFRLYRHARQRFRRMGHVTLLRGDSAVLLEGVVARLDQPALFWLDGHYSGGITAGAGREAPVLRELRHVLSAGAGHLVVIDDARCFGCEPGYPAPGEVTALVASLAPASVVTVVDDMIVVSPPRRGVDKKTRFGS